MGDQTQAKICCEEAYPTDYLYCDDCGDALEDPHYRRWIFLTFGMAVGIEWWLRRTEVLVEYRWSEVFMLEVFLLQIFYPLAKVVQKIRVRRRPVLREMATVFADRTSRILFIAAWTFIALLFTNVVPRVPVIGDTNLVDPTHLPIRRFLLNVNMIGFACVTVLILISRALVLHSHALPLCC